MSYLDVSEVRQIFGTLSEEYERLADTRKSLEQDCTKLKEFIEAQVQQLQSLNQDFEKLREEYVQRKRDLGETVNENGAAGEVAEEQNFPDWEVSQIGKTVENPVTVTLLAEIVDVSVICSVAFSPNDQCLAIGSNKILRVYNIESDKFIFQYTFEEESEGRTNHLRSLVWCPDGKTIICGGEDHNINVFKINDGDNAGPVATFPASEGEVFQVQISHDGTFLATTTEDGALSLFSLDPAKNYELIGRMIRQDAPAEPQNKIATSLSISADDTLIAVGYCDAHVGIWNVATKELVFEKKAHQEGVYSVKFLPNSNRLATSSLDTNIIIWDIKKDENGKPTLEKWTTLEGHGDFVLSLAVDPNGDWLLSGSKDLSAKLSSLKTGEMVYNIKAHTNSIITVAFNNIGSMFCTGSGDQAVKIWTMTRDEPENPQNV